MCRQWTVLLIMALSPGFAVAGEEDEVIETLTNYAAAMQNMSISEMVKYVDTSEAFTIFEGGLINRGWADFRDNHVGPEFKEIQKLQYSFSEIKPYVRGSMAYATLKWAAAVKTPGREASGGGLGTAVLTKQDGAWRLRHLHTNVVRK